MEYELIRSARKSLALQVKEGRLIVRAPMRLPKREIERFLQAHTEWIEKHLAQTKAAAAQDSALSQEKKKELYSAAKKVIPGRVAHYAALLGVSYGKITVRCQKTRWGSCSREGNLNFNCLLMLAPPAVLDSVVAHELCHRKEMNHSPRFYAELCRVFPNYDACAKWLKENGALLQKGISPERPEL